MIHADVRTSILITLLLVLMAQALFNPLGLSIILALMLLSLFFGFKKSAATFSKIWTFGFTILALGVIYFHYHSFIGVEAGVAVLSTFLFAKIHISCLMIVKQLLKNLQNKPNSIKI